MFETIQTIYFLCGYDPGNSSSTFMCTIQLLLNDNILSGYLWLSVALCGSLSGSVLHSLSQRELERIPVALSGSLLLSVVFSLWLILALYLALSSSLSSSVALSPVLSFWFSPSLSLFLACIFVECGFELALEYNIHTENIWFVWSRTSYILPTIRNLFQSLYMLCSEW